MSQIYSQEPTEAKFPLTNGSLFVHLMNPSSGDGKRGTSSTLVGALNCSPYFLYVANNSRRNVQRYLFLFLYFFFFLAAGTS
jgi:hypothetical protein